MGKKVKKGELAQKGKGRKGLGLGTGQGMLKGLSGSLRAFEMGVGGLLITVYLR